MTKFVRSSMFVLIAMSFILAACGAPATAQPPAQLSAPTSQVPVTAPTSASGATSAPAAAGSITINGAGSTFQQPAMSDWAFSYPKIDPSVVINYQGVGSGAGKKAIIGNTVDFAGSDAVL